MLRVLTLSTLFPNAAEPVLGPFVERQTLGLAARPDVALEVVAPVGLPVWPLSRHPHYAARAALAREEEWKGVRVHRPRYTVWPKLAESRTPAAIAAALVPLLTRIRERFAFDLIDAEFFWPDGPAAMALAEALGVPFSIKARGADIHYWGTRPDTGPQVLEAGLAAGGLLAVSEAMKASMAALGLPEDKIRVHYTGIEADAFVPVDRGAAKRALGLAGPLIVTAGALIPRKGQSFAIEALALVPEATLVLVGHGPDRPELEALVRRLGLDRRVRFLGAQPHAELPRWLAAADVTLLPSSSEGLANVWVESLSCGTPVVTTDVGGAREIVVGPDAGRLSPREPAALAAAVREILAAPPAQDAVRHAAAKFSWDRNAEELFEHLAAIDRSARAASLAGDASRFASGDPPRRIRGPAAAGAGAAARS